MFIHPTGSRFYGTSKPDSDWDYLVLINGKTMQEVKDYFATTEYKPCSDDYGDTPTRFVVRHPVTNVNLIILIDDKEYRERVALAHFCRMIKANKQQAYALHEAAFNKGGFLDGQNLFV